MVKQRSTSQWTIQRHLVQGCAQQIAALMQASQGQGGINTAFIERLKATFRERLTDLTRRTRALARQPETLQAGMYILGCVYNFCTYHQSLRVPFYLAKGQCRWLRRPPAIAAGLTDHPWSIEELFLFILPPPPWTPPTRRGPPSKQTLRLIALWCT